MLHILRSIDSIDYLLLVVTEYNSSINILAQQYSILHWNENTSERIIILSDEFLNYR